MSKIGIEVCRVGRFLLAGLILAAGVQAVQADEIRIKMLDMSASGPLAFEPSFLKARVGDTVIFEPTQKGGHSTVSLLVPPGAQAWSGVADKETRVTLSKEGVYLYACTAHKMMGMVGVIQAGNPVDLEAARQVAAQEASKFVMNKDRFEKELAQIK